MDFLDIEFFIHDIILTGSLSNYNWSKYSDVDLHILIDYNETEYNLDLLKGFSIVKKFVEQATRNFNKDLIVRSMFKT